jgi:hypothetical protein
MTYPDVDATIERIGRSLAIRRANTTRGGGRSAPWARYALDSDGREGGHLDVRVGVARKG